VWNLTAPLRAYHPRGSPGEHIDPAHPSLLVGNHTLFGVLHMLAKIHKERGVYVRSLGDRQTDVAVVEADHPARPISPEQLGATRRVPDENVFFRQD